MAAAPTLRRGEPVIADLGLTVDAESVGRVLHGDAIAVGVVDDRVCCDLDRR